jgi:hypothetical protein
VKAHYEFGNDPMKIMCFKHEIIMKIDNRIMMLKLCIIVFFSHNCDGIFFCHEFLMFGHAHIFLFFIVVCIHLRCYTTSDVHLVKCVLYEKKQLKISLKQKMKVIIFSSMFFLCIFLVKIYFDVNFYNLIKIYASHDCYITQAIW